MRNSQKDTYSVAFGEERILEIRSIAKLTGLKQSEIIRALWDNHKVVTIEGLLADREQSLEGTLENIKKLMEGLTKEATPSVKPAPKEPEPDEPDVVEDIAEPSIVSAEELEQGFDHDDEEGSDELKEDPEDFDLPEF